MLETNDELSTSGVDLAALCADERVKRLVLDECNALGTKNGFKHSEQLFSVILTPEEWTPENGFVTAAQKVKRVTIAQAFADQVKVCNFLFRLNLFLIALSCIGCV